jgi:hypothetical protein
VNLPSPTLPLIKTQRLTKGIRPFYIVPKKRYIYTPPPGFRDKKKSDTHKKSSPFTSMWYCWGGSDGNNGRLIKKAMEVARGGEIDGARCKSKLRDLRRKK